MFVRLQQVALAACLVTQALVSASDGFVRLDFDVFKGADFGSAFKNFLDNFSLDTRDGNGTQTVGLSNQKAFYVSSLKIGSNQDEVKVLVDTGSSDLWVMSGKNPQCTENGGKIDCEQYGTYNESASSTWKKNDSSFSILYLDNSYASGSWGQDTVDLNGNFKLEGANFAVADDSDSNVGVFGISYKEAESADSPYDNLPLQMKQQGYIKKVAYSLYLTSAESEKGTILFGGIDNAKYQGDLATIDISKQKGDLVYLQVPLTSVVANITSNTSEAGGSSNDTTTLSPSKLDITSWINGLSGDNSGSDNSGSDNSGSSSNTPISTDNVNAILDSGTTLSFLKDDVVKKLIDQISPGASYNNNYGGYVVSCTLRQPGNSVIFKLDNKKDIIVPLYDAVVEAGQNSQTGETICMLGITPNDQTILGDNFLRSAYTVFNLDDGQIQIGQMKYTDDEDIQTIQ